MAKATLLGKRLLRFEYKLPSTKMFQVIRNIYNYGFIDFEKIVDNYSDRYEDATSITIHGYPLLNKYDLEDINNLNIHAPVENINI